MDEIFYTAIVFVYDFADSRDNYFETFKIEQIFDSEDEAKNGARGFIKNNNFSDRRTCVKIERCKRTIVEKINRVETIWMNDTSGKFWFDAKVDSETCKRLLKEHKVAKESWTKYLKK